MKYTQGIDGGWVQPVRRGYKMACCDCGLVHVLDFRIVTAHGGVKGTGKAMPRIQFRASRDNRATAAKRRLKVPRKKTPSA